MKRNHKIVADGQRRAYDGNTEQVRAEVEAKYTEELKNAGFWRRRSLRRQMEREIQQRLEKTAPPGGLY